MSVISERTEARYREASAAFLQAGGERLLGLKASS
jgi:hypothetical protein